MTAPGHVRRADNANAPQVWATPGQLVLALEARYTADGFDLDAAADAENAIAEHWLGAGSSIGDDALTVPWSVPRLGALAVFVNPPWNNIEAFVSHALAEVEAGHCSVVVMVLPTRADTRWWEMLERPPSGTITQRDQIEGRVAYVDPLGTGRSAPAEGTTVWALRPKLRAADLRQRRGAVPKQRGEHDATEPAPSKEAET